MSVLNHTGKAWLVRTGSMLHSQNPVSARMKQSSNLDLLRAVAVSLVLFGHFVVYSGVRNAFFTRFFADIETLTWFAVLVFFIHTSLVLMMSLARLEKGLADGLVWRFYVRRAARIYPLAAAVVFICYAAHIPPFPGVPACGASAAERLSNLFLTQNITQSCVVSGPLWSLPFEVQMYLLLPAFYLFGKRLRWPAFIIAIGFVLWYISRKAVPYDLLRYAPWFSMGIYAFFRRTKQSLDARWFFVALVFLIGGKAASTHIRSFISGWIAFAIGIVFCHVLPMCRDISAAFITRPAAFIAKYSYGIYLVHAPLLWLVFFRLPAIPLYVRIPLFLALVMLASIALYHALEAPLIRFGARVSAPRAHSSAASELARSATAP